MFKKIDLNLECTVTNYTDAIASYGSYISALSSIFFFYVIYVTFTEGERVSKRNPWGLKHNN